MDVLGKHGRRSNEGSSRCHDVIRKRNVLRLDAKLFDIEKTKVSSIVSCEARRNDEYGMVLSKQQVTGIPGAELVVAIESFIGASPQTSLSRNVCLLFLSTNLSAIFSK